MVRRFDLPDADGTHQVEPIATVAGPQPDDVFAGVASAVSLGIEQIAPPVTVGGNSSAL